MNTDRQIRERQWYRYQSKGDNRQRCDNDHLICQRCRGCSCDSVDDIAEFGGRIVTRTDKRGRTWCSECRYQVDYLGNS